MNANLVPATDHENERKSLAVDGRGSDRASGRDGLVGTRLTRACRSVADAANRPAGIPNPGNSSCGVRGNAAGKKFTVTTTQARKITRGLRVFVNRVLVCVLLRLNGWRPCPLAGEIGWELVRPGLTLRGDWRYALSRLLG